MKVKLYAKAIITSIIFLTIIINYQVFATNVVDDFGEIEYSQEYLEWEKLDDSVKENSIMPRMYKVIKADYKIENPFKIARTIGGNLDSKFDLNTYIKENLVIKNQKNLGSCWAFTSLASLETNLALQNYNNGLAVKYYDFSERHMEYATSRIFKDNVVNEIGYGRQVGGGGSLYIAKAYLTNGTGAISESDMPYSDSTELIDISNIKGKEVISQIYDTITFPSKETTDIETLKQLMKEHIKKYSGIEVNIHEGNEGQNSEDFNNTCPNTKTGALYCDDASKHVINHGVLIVGWDDDYSVENFQEGHRPTNKGAWIAKDSHGNNEDRLIGTYEKVKEIAFEKWKSYFESIGITSPSQITDQYIEELANKNGWTIKDGKIYNILHNDDGYLYISYEDANVYNGMMGIIKADDKVSYDNIYQYDFYGEVTSIAGLSNKVYLANVFEKKTNSKEYLTQVAITTPETVTCKVYVNPNGTSKNKSDLQLVQLKEGESETFDAGYHTLEFLNPLEITENNFVVVVEIQGKRENTVDVSVEFNYPEYYKRLTGKDYSNERYKYVSIEKNKCFLTTQEKMENNVWDDLSQLSSYNPNLPDCDSTIKAFTVSSIEDSSLKNIEIVTPPTKTKYIEGQNFDKTGMVVKANYNNGKSSVIEEYNISNGTNLNKNQTSVTISYEGKTVNQPITVEENTVTKLEIVTKPTKLTYKAGNNFDKTGMVVKATYKDGTSKEVTDYTILDGVALKNGQTYVTISYKNNTVKLDITVEPNPLEKIEITTPPTKTKYVTGQNFDKTGMVVTATYEDGTKQAITNYEVIDGTNLNKNITYVTIKYEDKTVKQNITVEDKTITSITISSKPTKTKYIQNKETLDLTGGKIKAIYNDGTSEELEMTDEQVKVTGFENKNIGDITITVEYQTKTTTFSVSIVKEELPKNSTFNNANSNVISVKYYTFSDPSNKEYSIMNLEINNISRNTENDSYEYYYYLSANQEENDIENWVKITEKQDANDKLTFTINTKDIKNYAEIANSDVLYVYIKEVAKKGGNQSVLVSKSIKIDSDYTIETYLDNNKVNGVSIESDNQNGKDNTTATGIIPQTGSKITMFVIIGIIASIGIFVTIKIRNMKDIK